MPWRVMPVLRLRSVLVLMRNCTIAGRTCCTTCKRRDEVLGFIISSDAVFVGISPSDDDEAIKIGCPDITIFNLWSWGHHVRAHGRDSQLQSEVKARKGEVKWKWTMG
ncbi:hypothetical protein QQP08_007033, partial [Theobroma cacao]